MSRDGKWGYATHWWNVFHWALLTFCFAFFVALLGMISTLGYPFTFLGSFSDGVGYLYIADLLADGLSFSETNSLAVAKVSLGYPAMIALLGGGSARPEIAVIIQVAMVCVAVLMVLVYTRELIGSWSGGAVVAGMCLLMPWSLPWSLELTPDATLVFLIGALFVVGRAAIRSPVMLCIQSLLCASVCLILPSLAPVLIAMSVFLASRGIGWRWNVGAIVCALVPFCAWYAVSLYFGLWACSGDCASPNVGFPYSSDPRAFVERIPDSIQTAIALSFPASRRSILCGLIVLALALPSVIRAAAQRQFDGLFLLLSFPAALLLAPSEDRGFIVRLVFPFFAAMACSTLGSYLLRFRRWLLVKDIGSLAAVLLLSICVLLCPVWIQHLNRIGGTPSDASLEKYTRSYAWLVSSRPDAILKLHHQLIDVARAARKVVPSGECIYGSVPWIIGLHSGHRAVATPLPAEVGGPAPVAYECRWFLISGFGGPQDLYLPLYPLGDELGLLEPELVSPDGGSAALLVRR